MRTTLINTTFWEETEIDKLHLDSKLLYLYLLTNPKKSLANIYNYKPKVMSAYTGLSPEQIEVSFKQLEELGYICRYKDYYILLKGHEMAKKGRFTNSVIEKERQKFSDDVLDYFSNITDEKTENSSGSLPVYNTNTNTKDNIKTNLKDKGSDTNVSDELKFIHSEICKLFNKSESKYKLSDKRKQKLKLRLKDLGKEGILQACEAITRSEFHMGENQRNWIAEPYWVLENFERAEKWAGEYQNNNKYADLTKLEF